MRALPSVAVVSRNDLLPRLSAIMSYVLTPIGFYLGCLTIWPLTGKFPHMHVASPLFAASWLLVPFAAFVVWRSIEAIRAGRARMLAAHVWTPHRATAVIGIIFAISLIAIGPWAYTYALLSLAQGKTEGVIVKLVLLFMLFAGALVGGWTAGRLKLRAPTLETVIRCLGGGVLMGWGSLLIPGGNDELLLVGIPLLQAYGPAEPRTQLPTDFVPEVIVGILTDLNQVVSGALIQMNPEGHEPRLTQNQLSHLNLEPGRD